MAVAVPLSVGSIQDQVIAAPPITDQIAEPAPAAPQAAPVDAPAEMPDAASAMPTLTTVTLAVIAVAVLALFFWRRLHRLPSAPPRPELMTPGMSFALFIAFQLLALGSGPIVVVLGGVELADGAEAARRLTIEENAKLAIGRAVAQAVAVVIFVRLCLADRSAPQVGRPGPGRAAALGAMAMLLLWPVTYTVAVAAGLAWSALAGKPVDPVAHDTLKLMVRSEIGGWFVTLTVLVVLVAPIVEEIMYRGLIQDMLRRLGLPAWPAIVLASVVFAGMHWSNARPHALAALFVLSLGFGWAYARTGRLAAPIAMHVVFNAGNLALGLLSRS